MKKSVMTFALKNNILTCISDVESGLKCGCTCPQCGAVLVAHKGKKKAHHFKHYNSEECEGGYQTSLHLLAKEILSNEEYFVIPPVIYNFNQNGNFINIPAQKIKIDRVELEKRTDDIIPDIVLYCSKKILLIEIYVTHKIDENKLNKIKSLGLSTIEIDLSKTDREISYENLRNILINDFSEKKWGFNNYVDKCKKLIYSISKEYKIIYNSYSLSGHWGNIYDCSQGSMRNHRKSYANFHEDCMFCPYLVCDNSTSIRCIGEAMIVTLDDLKKFLSKK